MFTTECLSCKVKIEFDKSRQLIGEAVALIKADKDVGYSRSQSFCNACQAKLMAPHEVLKLLERLEAGETVSLKFIKADGTLREMTCNRGEGASSYSRKPNLFTKVVYDVGEKAFRSIPLDRILK